MADFFVYDRNGRYSGVHKDPEAAKTWNRRDYVPKRGGRKG